MLKVLSVTLLLGSLAVYAQTDTPAGTGAGTGTVSPAEETRGGSTQTRPGTFDEEREETRTGTDTLEEQQEPGKRQDEEFGTRPGTGTAPGTEPGTVPGADSGIDQERQQGTDLGTEGLETEEQEEPIEGFDTTTPGETQTDDPETL
jgi:hypothetical protein